MQVTAVIARKDARIAMKSKRMSRVKLGTGLTAMMVFMALVLAGCTEGAGDGTVSEAAYISFILGKFTTMSSAATGLNDQVNAFTDQSLEDTTWVETTKKNLETLQGACDEIIAFTGTPPKYQDIHGQLVDLATQGKEAMTQYEMGIDQKDYDTLQLANAQISKLSDNMGSYVTTIKDKLSEAQ